MNPCLRKHSFYSMIQTFFGTYYMQNMVLGTDTQGRIQKPSLQGAYSPPYYDYDIHSSWASLKQSNPTFSTWGDYHMWRNSASDKNTLANTSRNLKSYSLLISGQQIYLYEINRVPDCNQRNLRPMPQCNSGRWSAAARAVLVATDTLKLIKPGFWTNVLLTNEKVHALEIFPVPSHQFSHLSAICLLT